MLIPFIGGGEKAHVSICTVILADILFLWLCRYKLQQRPVPWLQLMCLWRLGTRDWDQRRRLSFRLCTLLLKLHVVPSRFW